MIAVRLRSVPIALACLGLGLLALGAGCSKPNAATTGPQAPSGQAPTVTTVRPEQKTLSRVIEQPAFVEAYEETPLMAKIAGEVQHIHVDRGHRVRGPHPDVADRLVQVAGVLDLLGHPGAAMPLSLAGVLRDGQVLAELWVPEMEEELRQKKALVGQVEAEVEQAAAAVDAAEANVVTAKAMIREAEAARTRAQANYERWNNQFLYEEDLVRRKSLDKQSLEITRNQRQAALAAQEEVEAKVLFAEATAKESEAKRNKARADLVAAKARVQVAKAEERRLSALLEYSKVRAPYDGVITSRNIHTGHYLTGTGAKPLFVIARTDTVRILVDVPEADAMYVSDGVPARIRCQIIKDQEFEGKVTRSSWVLDAKARTLRTEIDLPNPEGKLRPGMYAYVTFRADVPSQFTLPAAAVVTQGDQSCCFCVENGKAIRIPVKVGARDGQLVQVLKKRNGPAKGSEPGVWEDFTGKEEVVLSSPGSLSDGQPVIVGQKP